MSKPAVDNMPPGLEKLRREGLQAYTLVRKTLHLLDRLHKGGIEGHEAYSAGRLLDELDRLSRNGPLADFEKHLREWIGSTRERIRAGQEEFKSWFGSELERLLKERYGLELRGRFPTFVAGAFRIHLDLERDQATLSYGADEERLERFRVDPGVAAEKINTRQRELEGNLLPDEAFLERFAEAYDRVVRLAGLNPGERVPILQVLKEFVWGIQSRRFLADPRRDNFRPYSRVNLSYQLYRLSGRRTGGRELELTVATREHTSRKTDHLWVPTNDAGDGTHFAYVAFR